MSTMNLLVELFVEELPPKALKKLGESFGNTLFSELKGTNSLDEGAVLTTFASPRRLAAHITNVLSIAASKPVKVRLMPVSVALDAEGAPTPALKKKLESLGFEYLLKVDKSVWDERISREGEGKNESLFYSEVAAGMYLHESLQIALIQALAKLPIPKVMTYQLADGWNSVQFVRPAHGLVALHGDKVVSSVTGPIEALGLVAGKTTQGHRFEAAVDTITLRDADSYEQQLESEGAVIASFEKRRAEIVHQLQEAAAKEGLKPIEDAALLDEVTALVERPNVLTGRFEDAFLEVPQECLILTMKANQKYFPLLDDKGKLSNRFLLVSNIRPADPSAVIGGNERVVRPRLADAKFFFDQDRKVKLAARAPKLGNVVYHNKLGSQLQRVQRIEKLAGEIAQRLGANVAYAERAAHLCKADLVTDMVGEFPELQGIMGRYYALHDGEPREVADAIEAHYHPRYADDTLPRDNVSAAVALADKLDTLVGIYGIGLVPTGDKDPFALRRLALGVLRILYENALPLDLVHLLQLAKAQYAGEVLTDSVAVDVHGFMLERLKNYLREQGYEFDEIDAVLAQSPARIDLVGLKLRAVQAFKKLPEAAALAAANKRIQNILKKTEAPQAAPDLALMQVQAERNLLAATTHLAPAVESLMQNGDYTDALCALAKVRAQVDSFFDDVMVMVDEPLLRNNRLALLNQLAGLMNRVADISRLAA